MVERYATGGFEVTMTLDIIVAPGSGTGELTGITGRLAIRSKARGTRTI